MDLRGRGFDQAGDDVNLAQEFGLSGKPAIALHLAQPGGVEDVWRFTIRVRTEQGDWELAQIETRPPAAGDPTTRVIAMAYCPGAVEWTISAVGPQGANAQFNATADRECCGIGAIPGVLALNGSFIRTSTWVPAFAAQQGILSTGPGTLYVLKGFIDPAAGPLFVGVVDKAAAVVNGDPWLDIPVSLPLGATNFSITWNPRGIKYNNQLRFAVSSTPGTVTLAGAVQAISAERI